MFTVTCEESNALNESGLSRYIYRGKFGMVNIMFRNKQTLVYLLMEWNINSMSLGVTI